MNLRSAAQSFQHSSRNRQNAFASRICDGVRHSGAKIAGLATLEFAREILAGEPSLERSAGRSSAPSPGPTRRRTDRDSTTSDWPRDAGRSRHSANAGPGHELVEDSDDMSRADDLNLFQRFVDGARWRFAKAYVESYPHEYSLRRWVDADDFWNAIRCIEEWGVVEAFWQTRRKYLYVDDRKYWHMGAADSPDPAQRPGLINRTWLDVSRYRDEAEALGYQGAELDALVERWSELLARAKEG